MSLLDDYVPDLGRRVIRIGDDCPACRRPVPVLGLPGKGRDLDTFGPDYFCHGHATRVS